MKIAAVIHWKTGNAPGVRCFSNLELASRLVAADLHQELQDRRNAALADPELGRRRAEQAQLEAAGRAALLEAKDDVERQAVTSALDEVAVLAAGVDRDLRDTLASIDVEMKQRIDARAAQLHQVGDVLVWWPEALGAFPSPATLTAWEAEYDARPPELSLAQRVAALESAK